MPLPEVLISMASKFWNKQPMTAPQSSSLKRKLFAGTGALIGACLVLLMALPGVNKTSSFETLLVYAGVQDQASISTPVPLTDSITLEAGATIKFRRSLEATSTSVDESKSVKVLELTNAVFIVEQSAATRTQSATAITPVVAHHVSPLLQDIRRFGFTELHLVASKLQLRRPGGSVTKMGLINGVIRTGADSGVLTANGQFVRHGKTLEFDADVDCSATDSTASPLRLTLKGSNIELALDGDVITDGGLRVTSEQAQVSSQNIRQLLAWLGVQSDDRNGGVAAFSVRGHLSWTGSTIAFDHSEFEIGGNKANGRLSFNLDTLKPSVEGTLAFATLNVGSFLASTADGDTRAVGKMHSAWHVLRTSATKGALPLELAGVDADIRLSAKSVRNETEEIGRGAAVILVNDGKLQADIANIELANGAKGRAQIEIDTSGFVPSYIVRGNFDNVDLSIVSQSWLGRPLVDGIANLTFDLSAQGQRDDQLLSTLTGPIVVTAQNGATIPVDIAKLFTTVKAAPNDGWKSITGGYTALKDVSVKLMSSQGALMTESVRASIGGNALVAQGSLKLSDLVLDLVLTKLAPSGDEAGGATPAGDDALEFKGPISEPIIRLRSSVHKG